MSAAETCQQNILKRKSSGSDFGADQAVSDAAIFTLTSSQRHVIPYWTVTKTYAKVSSPLVSGRAHATGCLVCSNVGLGGSCWMY